MRFLATIAVFLFAVGVAEARAPVGLAPGPWQLVSAKHAVGAKPTVTVFARWNTQDVSTSTGFVPHPPIPKRMAYVVTESPGQPVAVRWTSLCYPNHEHSFGNAGAAHGTGSVVGYPVLYPGRVECDLYLYVQLSGRGTVHASIYAY